MAPTEDGAGTLRTCVFEDRRLCAAGRTPGGCRAAGGGGRWGGWWLAEHPALTPARAGSLSGPWRPSAFSRVLLRTPPTRVLGPHGGVSSVPPRLASVCLVSVDLEREGPAQTSGGRWWVPAALGPGGGRGRAADVSRGRGSSPGGS